MAIRAIATLLGVRDLLETPNCCIKRNSNTNSLLLNSVENAYGDTLPTILGSRILERSTSRPVDSMSFPVNRGIRLGDYSETDMILWLSRRGVVHPELHLSTKWMSKESPQENPHSFNSSSEEEVCGDGRSERGVNGDCDSAGKKEQEESAEQSGKPTRPCANVSQEEIERMCAEYENSVRRALYSPPAISKRKRRMRAPPVAMDIVKKRRVLRGEESFALVLPVYEWMRADGGRGQKRKAKSHPHDYLIVKRRCLQGGDGESYARTVTDFRLPPLVVRCKKPVSATVPNASKTAGLSRKPDLDKNERKKVKKVVFATPLERYHSEVGRAVPKDAGRGSPKSILKWRERVE